MRYVLGSSSPQRRVLLAQLVPDTAIDVRPPASSEEAGFDGLTTWDEIRERLQLIARTKLWDVLEQLGESSLATVITADTTTVAESPDGRRSVLGKPPADESWPEVVRAWFRDHFAGREHLVATAVCVWHRERGLSEAVAETRVAIRDDVEPWLDWYLATGEPCGKSGGYAIQGAGSVFVTRIDGSLSNVIGLPLETLRPMLG